MNKSTKPQPLHKEYDLLQNRLHATLEIVTGVHWLKNQSGVYQDCNEAMAKALGFQSREDIIGKTDHELPWAGSAKQLLRNDNC